MSQFFRTFSLRSHKTAYQLNDAENDVTASVVRTPIRTLSIRRKFPLKQHSMVNVKRALDMKSATISKHPSPRKRLHIDLPPTSWTPRTQTDLDSTNSSIDVCEAVESCELLQNFDVNTSVSSCMSTPFVVRQATTEMQKVVFRIFMCFALCCA